ncbi:MAG: competence protein [Syntrophomonadaceae bacterium]|nr:competence protein [Syntrophomonadaceae bacterium]
MLTSIFTYGPLAAAVLALAINWRGMKKYIPAGLFASLYANIVCHVAMNFNLWTYPNKIEEAIVNCVIVPVLAMFWIRYRPNRFYGLLKWNLVWTGILTGFELYAERFTGVIKYHNGYDWYYSFILWFVSFFVWYGFYIWFNVEEGI